MRWVRLLKGLLKSAAKSSDSDPVPSAPVFDPKLVDDLGIEALGFLLAMPPAQVRAAVADPEGCNFHPGQLKALRELSQVRKKLEKHELYLFDCSMLWARFLSIQIAGETRADLIRHASGGRLGNPAGTDSLEGCLRTLVSDVYVSFLLPPRIPTLGAVIGDPGGECFQNPVTNKLWYFIMQDPALKRLFPDDSTASGPSGYTMQSTGNGGTTQLWSFPGTMISAGVKLSLIEDSGLTPDLVTQNAIRCINWIRKAICGEQVTVPVRIGLAGVLLPEGQTPIDVEWARIRPTTPYDDHLPPVIPRTTPDTLGALNVDGQGPVIQYSGDVVVEMNLPYSIRLADRESDIPGPMVTSDSRTRLTEAIENLRLGLLLTNPDERTPIVFSWQYVFDPMSPENGMSWTDTSLTPNLHPTQLKPDEAMQWAHWSKRIHDHRIEAIGISIRRLLRAVAERVDPDDSLIDAVIVWENLLGPGPGPGITEKLTRALALLLAQDKTDTNELDRRSARYRKLYSLRSRVVHGDGPKNLDQFYADTSDAIAISVQVLRVIFEQETDLLRLKKSSRRCDSILSRDTSH